VLSVARQRHDSYNHDRIRKMMADLPPANRGRTAAKDPGRMVWIFVRNGIFGGSISGRPG
jgi:hypothetical protein